MWICYLDHLDAYQNGINLNRSILFSEEKGSFIAIPEKEGDRETSNTDTTGLQMEAKNFLYLALTEAKIETIFLLYIVQIASITWIQSNT